MATVTTFQLAVVLSIMGLCAAQQHCYSCVATVATAGSATTTTGTTTTMGVNATTMSPTTANALPSSISIGGMVYNGASVMQSGEVLSKCPVYACTAVYDSCMAQQISTTPLVIQYSCQIYMNCLNVQQYGSGSLSTVNCCLGQYCNVPVSAIPRDPAYSSASLTVIATGLVLLNALLATLLL